MKDWRSGVEGGGCLRLVRGKRSELAFSGCGAQDFHSMQCGSEEEKGIVVL